MTVIGGDGSEDGSVGSLSVGDTTFSWANKTWKIDNITYRGNYQSKKMYDISFHRAVNFP